MRKPYFALLAAPLLVTACQEPGQIFATDSGVAEAQGKLATDPAQAALWQEAAGSGAAAGIESVPVPKEDAVSTLNPPAIADTSAAKGRVPFDSSVTTGVVIVEAPQNLERYSGSARVQSVEGEFLTLDLGDKGTLVVQAKVEGAPLRAASGETAQVTFRQGNPFEPNNLLALRLPNDALLYTLVGSQQPVRLSVESFAMNGRQSMTEKKGAADGLQQNAAAVRLTLRGQTHVLAPGEQADFAAADVTVKVLSSIAVEGESANAVEGDPYRLELLGWRTRP